MTLSRESLGIGLRAERALEDLRELARLTSDDTGAQRVAWTPTWSQAREWLTAKLAAIGIAVQQDAAANLWTELPGAPGPAILLGSHLDSVPEGGWLDGALGVVGALEVLRTASEGEWQGPTLRLVDWADEEGARLGHSLLGSSLATGQVSPEAAADLCDDEGNRFADLAPPYGVDLGAITAPTEPLRDVGALLELHIEQGPVLEAAGVPLGIPEGAVAIHRLAVAFTGLASHAGTTPMENRRDASLAAAELALAVREIATRHSGLGTTGVIDLRPGIATAVAGNATIAIDLRHRTDTGLEAMIEEIEGRAAEIANAARLDHRSRKLWSFPKVEFDERLVRAVEAAADGPAIRLTSGALHDAVGVARAGVPTAMIFVRSLRGISHSPLEESRAEDLEAGLRTLGQTVQLLSTAA
jgi:hydantoinase/carbamoylase family amidase